VIFVTVGGQLPFDRLIHTVDQWAADQQRSDVFAQIGSSQSPPGHIEWQRFLSPSEFRAKARDADVIIAHAGMGSILTALEVGKPIIVMPRRAHLGEHRNDHQWATVNRLGADVGIVVAANEEALLSHLGRLEELQGPGKQSSQEHARLLKFLRSAIEGSE
jgi:UDP-N-acetylglucosamine transferase subunit ALG13